MTENSPTPSKSMSSAAAAVILVLVFILAAGGLGIALGTIKIGNTVPPLPPKSNPITVP